MAVYTDNFNRANETPLASPWGISGTGGINLVTNQASNSGDVNDNEAYYSTAVAAGDQYAQAKITTAASGEQGIGVVCRHIGTATRTFVRAVADTGGVFTVRTFAAGASTLVGTRTSTFASNDVLRMEVRGTSPNIVIKVFKNGVQVGADFTAVTGPNTGIPGLCYSSQIACTADDWEGGDFVSAGNPARQPLPFQPQGRNL